MRRKSLIDLNDLESSIVEVYNDYYLDVFRFLVCFTGNQNDAEDLTQEVFIRLLKNLNHFKSEYNLKTWIFSIAKHVAVDHYRKRSFSPFLRMDSSQDWNQTVRSLMKKWNLMKWNSLYMKPFLS